MTEKMKPSGIAWIGDVPQSWKISRLKYNVTCLDERRIPVDAALRNPGPYPYWGAGSIVDYVDNYIFDEELVLLGEDGAPFFDKYRPVAFLIAEKIWANNHIHVIKGKPGICNRFLAHYLNSVEYREYINGSILNKLTQGNMNEIVCPIPSNVEQEAIADFLDSQCAKIDSVIADLEKQIEALQKYKKSLITETVTKGLDQSVPMKDSRFDWVPEIPTSWGVDRLGNISNLRNGYVGPTKDILVDEGEPYIQSLHVKNGKIVFGEDFYVTATWGKHHPKITKGDILLVQTGEIGQIALVDERYDGCNCHALIICSPDAKRVYPAYLLYYLMSSVGNSQLMIYETGTTLKHLNSTKIKNSKVIIPPVEVQKDIADFLDVRTKKIDAIIETKQKQMETMLSHKKSLIYEYVTGKKRVTEVN